MKILPSPTRNSGRSEKMLESYKMLKHSNEMIALEKERLLLHIHYYGGGIAIFTPDREKQYANPRFIQYVNTLLDRPTPDLNDIWKSSIFSPLLEFLERNTPVKNDSAPVFNFKLSRAGITTVYRCSFILTTVSR